MAALVLSVLSWLLVEAVTAYPNYFFDGAERSCDQGMHPTKKHGHHASPIWDTTVNVVLTNVGDESATPVGQWKPSTQYNLTISGPVPIAAIVSTTSGALGNDTDPGVKCDRKAWVTSHIPAISHSVLWQSPECCAVADNLVQIVTTVATCKTGHFRQDEAYLSSACQETCTSGLKPDIMEMPVVSDEADVCTTTSHEGGHHHHHHGDEGDEGDEGAAPAHDDEGTTATTPAAGDAAAVAGADAPAGETAGVAAAEEADGSRGTQEKAARSFGVFVLVATSAAVVGGVAVIIIRRRRMRQQYQDFGTLEMRGYNQWGSEAGM